MFRAKAVCAVVAAGLIIISAAQAQDIPYGNYNAVSVVYQQVTENSTTDPGVALYGAPSVSGDSLNFSPTNFGINTSNGSFDFMDGTLTATLQAISGYNIEKIQFSERGDYTLGGTGTAATSATVANSLFVRITNVTGGSIDPITCSVNMTFNPSDGTYNLIDDPGVGVIWQGDLLVDIDAILLAAGYGDRKATTVDISMDNSLMAFSEPGTISYIKKKQVEGLSITAIVPEPATLGLLLLGGLFLRRR